MPKIVDHDEQRGELSATVAGVIACSGLENCTLRTVAARHGCTKGMVQHYFVDKEALLVAALVFVENRFSEAALGAAGRLRGLDRVQAALRAQLPLKPDICRDWQVRLVFHTRSAPSRAMRELITHYHEKQHGDLMSGLREAHQAGELRPGVPLLNSVRSLQALLWGVALGAAADPEQTPASAQRQILRSALDSLRA